MGIYSTGQRGDCEGRQGAFALTMSDQTLEIRTVSKAMVLLQICFLSDSVNMLMMVEVGSEAAS